LQKQMQELLKMKTLLESNQNIVESIFKAVDIGQLVIELDNSWNIIRINNMAIQLFNLIENDVLGKPFVEVFNSDKTTNQLGNVLESLKSGNAITLTGKYTLKDNSVIWLNEIYSPVLDAGNNMIKILVLAVNISQQRELEELKTKLLEESNVLASELQKKQLEFEEQVSKSGMFQSEFDSLSAEKLKTIEALNYSLPMIETDLDLNIVLVNKKFCEMFKYPERELLNKHISRVLPFNEKDVLAVPRSDFKEGEAIEIQVKIQSRDRQIFPVNMNLIPFYIDKKGSEKVLIYISGGDFGLVPESSFNLISDELEMKKTELKKITERIERIKSEKPLAETGSVSESDELYNKWLSSIKGEFDKK